MSTPSFDELDALLAPMRDQQLQDFLDPGQVVLPGAIALTARGPAAFDAAIAAIEEILTGSPDEATIGDVLAVRLGLTWQEAPEDGGWRGYLVALRTQLAAWREEHPAAGEQCVNGRPDMALPRVSLFNDIGAGNTASTQALQANQDSLLAWGEDRAGHARWCAYTDTGEVIGRIMTAGVKGTLPATAIAVMMRTDPEGNPFIQCAYPEVVLSQATRTQYPDLCHLFGGYFGQDWDTVDITVWGAQQAFLRDSEQPARAAIRSQLEQLLTLDDDQLRAAVQSLGSYVMPGGVRLRGWLTRMLHRID